MTFSRITTPGRPAVLPPATAIEELALGGGLYCRVVITRGAVDPRTVADNQANVENLVTVTKKAVQIDANGDIVSRPDGLASGTRTTAETVDITSIGDTHGWRAGWVRATPEGNWHPGNLPAGCVEVAALPDAPSVGDLVYLDPHVRRYDAGLIAAMVDSKGDELLRILRNSAQLAGTEF